MCIGVEPVWLVSKSEEMNIKQKIANALSLLVIVIQSCYICLVTVFPDPVSRWYYLSNPGQIPHIELEPTSFDLMATLSSQRYTSLQSLANYMENRFADNADLMGYLDWLAENLAQGERNAMNQLSELRSFLDQGGKLYIYSCEHGESSEYGLIVIKDGKEIFRLPFINVL